jgi:hypothetical protein
MPYRGIEMQPIDPRSQGTTPEGGMIPAPDRDRIPVLLGPNIRSRQSQNSPGSVFPPRCAESGGIADLFPLKSCYPNPDPNPPSDTPIHQRREMLPINRHLCAPVLRRHAYTRRSPPSGAGRRTIQKPVNFRIFQKSCRSLPAHLHARGITTSHLRAPARIQFRHLN